MGVGAMDAIVLLAAAELLAAALEGAAGVSSAGRLTDCEELVAADADKDTALVTGRLVELAAGMVL